jgi:hypothetical protein
MPKRTLAVLGVAAFAGLALPLGLPQMAQASGTIASISLMPFPIAPAGTLVGSQTVNMCIQPRDSSGGMMGVGQPVFLSFYPGLFTAPPAPGGTAKVLGAAGNLTTTPTSFNTIATCTSQGGTVSPDSIAVTYTAPANPIPAHGRDVIIAADSAVDSGSTGVCPGSGVCNNGTYVYSPVTQYAFAPAPPIATNGSLSPGQVVNFTVTAEDSGGHDIPGSFINLVLNSTATPNGTATAFNHFSGFPKDKITNTPERFGSDNNGTVQIAYTAGSATAGTDTITAQDHPNTPTVTATTTYTYGSTVGFSKAPYTAVPPFRVCDTRPAGSGITANQCDAPGNGPIPQNTSRAVHVTGGLVPSTATAIVVNLTAIAPSHGTFVTLFPTGGTGTHTTSNVNPLTGQVVAVLAEVAIGTGGDISVYNNMGSLNVALDVEGYVDSTSTGLFTATAPTRICDTRAVGGGVSSNQCDNSSPGSHPIGPNGVLTINMTAPGSPIPSSGVTVTSVVFNLTAIAPTVRTVLTAYPGDLPTHPIVSNVNVEAGKALANRVIVPVPAGCAGATCTVKLWNSLGLVNVAVDVDGWFGTGAGAGTAQFTALSTPARVCDTVTGGNAQGCSTPGTVPPGGVLNINVTGIDGIPALGSANSPVALVANITAFNATTGTFITVYPGNLSTPNASDINVATFFPVTNLVVVGIDPATGTINLFNDLGHINLIVDVYGYYS